MSLLTALNVFTNARVEAPSTSVLERTLASFQETFGDGLVTTVYYDPHPFVEHADEYRRNLDSLGFRVVETTGFAHGYLRSIVESTAPFLFQLEDDWSFQHISHSLHELRTLMDVEKICHLRFSRHSPVKEHYPNKWCSHAVEKEWNGIKYLETDNVSNNPHIIDRRHYIANRLQYIDPTQGESFGVEENMTRKNLLSCQYGGWDHPATLTHLTKLTKKRKK